MPPTLDDFAQQILSTGLVEDAELRALRAGLPENATAEGLGKRLVTDGKLTSYQASMIYQGRGKNLSIGDYVLVDKLGKGGMGVVFRAYHRHMDREVALKVLPSSAVGTKEKVQRFRREVKAAAKLFHQNVVTALDASESRGLHYLVSELVDGPNLSELVRKKGPFTVAKAIQAVIDAGRGLAYAHDKGIVHRDVKPGNMLMDPDGMVKVLDMGLARFEAEVAEEANDQLTVSGMVMGTIDYIAPEQATSTKAADARADIYSLGCTLYYLLVGKPIYQGNTPYEKIHAHINAPIPKLGDQRPNLPDPLIAVFERMVAKNPTERYQSMKDVINDLEACLASESTATIAQDDASPTGTQSIDWLQAASATATIPIEGPGPRRLEETVESIDMSGGEPTHVGATLSGSSQLGRRRAGWVLPTAIGSLVVFLGMAVAGIVVIFRDRDGNEVARMKVPKGGSFTVEESSGPPPTEPTNSDAPNTSDPVASDETPFPMADPAVGKDVPLAKVYGGPPKPFWRPSRGLALSPDGSRLAAVIGDGRLKIWLCETGELAHDIALGKWVNHVAFLADGSTVAASTEGTIKRFDIATGNLRDEFTLPFRGRVRLFAFTPDGKTFATTRSGPNSVGHIDVWDWEEQRNLASLEGHQRPITRLRLSRDGKRLLSSSEDRTVRLWGVDAGEEILPPLRHAKPVKDVLFTPDETQIVSLGFEPRLWDAKTGKLLRTYLKGSFGFCADLTEDGADLYVGRAAGEIQHWRLDDAELVDEWQVAGGQRNIFDLAASSDGKMLAWAELSDRREPGGIGLWDTVSGSQWRAIGGEGTPYADAKFDATGNLVGCLFSGEGTLTLLDVASGERLRTFETGDADDGRLFAHARRLVTRTDKGAGTVWDTTSGEELLEFEPVGMRRNVQISPDGRWCFTWVREDDGATLHDLTKEMPPRELGSEDFQVQTAAFSVDSGTIALGGKDGRVRLVDGATAKTIREWKAQRQGVHVLLFSPDGNHLVSVGEAWKGDGSINLWETRAVDKPAVVLRESWDPSLMFDPSGRLLVMSTNQFLDILDGHTGRQVERYEIAPVDAKAELAGFSPDGTKLATLNGNGTIYVLDLAKDENVAPYLTPKKE
ncbi:Serine/threonine-protein kinase PrkC [Planctomycetes bacterium Pan216]|uniref:Serine/threonine-protein kinase PrkC n=1 Tax=Kolteria novifilia TaxID=2527975 RepID=A0A518B9Q2_9BACT|nr:Serine/threonine-protein kinase PrkC [Planctomycetes bacterium Pan216]